MTRTIAVFLLMTINLYSYESYFFLAVGSGDRQSKVRVQIIDSQGRMTGFTGFEYDEQLKLMIPSGVNEIPNSNCLSESVGSINPDTNEPVDDPTPESIHCGINNVSKDTYTIRFIGLDNSTFTADMYMQYEDGKYSDSILYDGYISSGTTQDLKLFLDPTPGAPPPVLTKVVTFQTIRDDLNVAYKLNQIGDEKFVKSLIKMVDVAEKLSKRCEKPNKKSKPKCYMPSAVILRMISKRLEIVNRLCNNPDQCKSKCKKQKGCDIDKAFKHFEKKYKKDKELKKFFKDYYKDKYYKHKKKYKRFVTDEALEIISSDINWLIKSFGNEVWKNYKKELNPYIPKKYKKFFK